MKYFIDTEFIEYPCTIDLISIGIICEDERKLYCVSRQFDVRKANDWVKDNVILKIPDEQHYMSRKEIKTRILEYIGDDKPEFYGYYADYDWVVFCWLFGAMIDLPKGWPMYCRDIKQMMDEKGNPKKPDQKEGEHNALSDAIYHKELYEWITKVYRNLR